MRVRRKIDEVHTDCYMLGVSMQVRISSVILVYFHPISTEFYTMTRRIAIYGNGKTTCLRVHGAEKRKLKT